MSYPFMRLAKERGIAYGDVLLVTDIMWPNPGSRVITDQHSAAFERIGPQDRLAIRDVIKQELWRRDDVLSEQKTRHP